MMKTICKHNSLWTEAKRADAIINELNKIPSILEPQGVTKGLKAIEEWEYRAK